MQVKVRRLGDRRAWRPLILLLTIFLLISGLAVYLANAQTTYTITLYPIADANIDSRYPDTNYGAETESTLYRGYNRFYIKFNFTATGITTNLPNLRYYLRFYIVTASIYVGDYPAVYATSNSWSESTITWNTAPAANSTTYIVKATSTPPANSWVQLDITNFVIANCMTKTCSFIITFNDITASGSTGYYMKIRTKDYSDQNYWPHILIQYQALTTVTQTFTVTTTETVKQTNTQTVTETVTTTQTFTIYDTRTITTVTTMPITITETTTETMPVATVTITNTIAGSTVTAYTETTVTMTEFSTLTKTITTTLYNTIYQTMTETLNQTLAAREEMETQAIDQILTLFMTMIPIIIVLVVLKGVMGAAR